MNEQTQEQVSKKTKKILALEWIHDCVMMSDEALGIMSEEDPFLHKCVKWEMMRLKGRAASMRAELEQAIEEAK